MEWLILNLLSFLFHGKLSCCFFVNCCITSNLHNTITINILIFFELANTVEPCNNSLAFKGSPSIKANILRSQMIVFNVISPLFKGEPEIKERKFFSPKGSNEAGFYCIYKISQNDCMVNVSNPVH